MLDQRIYSFITLAKEGSFTKTAEVLNMTQPAISQHISSIEREFMIKLFHKNGRTLTITKEGAVLLKYCTRLESLDTSMHNAIDDLKKNSIHIDIGLTPTASESLVPTIIKTINEDQKTTLNIHINPIKELYERLDSYEYDFLIGDELLGKQDDYIYTKIYSDILVFIASTKIPIAETKNLSIDDLKNLPFILRNIKSTTRNQFTSYLLLHNDSIDNFNVNLEIESIPIIKELVSIDYGISLLPYIVCKKEIEEGKIKALDVKDFKIERTTYLIYRKDSDIPNIIKGFAKNIKHSNY